MEFFIENINLVLFLPLVVCGIIGFNSLLSNKIDKSTLFLISAVSTFICVIFSICAFGFSFVNNTAVAEDFQWISSENINFYLGTFLDKVSVSFLLPICIISFVLQIIAYLKIKDSSQYLKLLFLQNLFLFAYNGIILSPNLFQSYLFCEILGVDSYLLINFDFSNRDESKAGIKSFIYNRMGDLVLLFCLITLLYYSVVFNEIDTAQALSYSNVTNIAATVNSLMASPVFILFCSMLIVVIIMKFMQAFVYITFENIEKDPLSRMIFYQNCLIGLVGLFLFLRLDVFFFELGEYWAWTIPVLIMFFVILFFSRILFFPICRIFGWIEKYIVDSFVNFSELVIRALSYICNIFQRGNFQTYLIFSFVGLIFILGFVLVFYEFFIKI